MIEYREYGSDFHWIDFEQDLPKYPWIKPCFTGSGRDAIRLLLMFGKTQLGWKRIWIPTYYCPQVVQAIISTGIQTKRYNDSPISTELLLNQMDFEYNDILLLVNYFGMRNMRSISWAAVESCTVIEDHTHDLVSEWTQNSTAHYCFASLRKTLPLPDGGVIWSPQSLVLPQEPPLLEYHRIVTELRLQAMHLKTQYLKGVQIDKEIFLHPQRITEEHIATNTISGIHPASLDILKTFPLDTWTRGRRDNYVFAKAYLTKIQGVSILEPHNCSGYLFSLVISFTSESLRDLVRSYLISLDIYPAILWKVENDSSGFSKTMLSIACDARYTIKDMQYVIEKIRNFMKE